MSKNKELVSSLLKRAGITINGNADYDIQVHNEKLYGRILRQGSLGIGESYMDGWWDCKNLDQFFYKVLSTDLENQVKTDADIFIKILTNFILNAGRRSKAFQVGKRHYDTGNDLFEAMLDKRMAYTCGYWKNAKNLDRAQEAKLDLICKKIGLKRDQTVLDIGSGWGSFTGYAAEKYGAIATGVTVSREQKALTDKRYKKLPVTTKLMDYREITGIYDHVISIGMFEHVGYKNYRHFMQLAHNSLSDNGLFLLHTIGGNNTTHTSDQWLNKYIFSTGMIPSIKQIGKSIEGLFVMEDWHNFGPDYDKTLMAWHKNFEANWGKLKVNYDERFHRMWRYYLLSSAGAFRARKLQLWQIVLSKNGVPGEYKSIR